MSELTRHTLFLRTGDMQRLRDKFPAIGASSVVRRLVSGFLDRIDLPVPDEDIKELMAEEAQAKEEVE